MNCCGDVADNWELFRESYEDFVAATELSEKEAAVQVASLKTLMGEECRKILKRLAVSQADMLVPARILDALGSYFMPSRNVLYERYLFHSASQQIQETVDQYFVRLRKLAETCQFGVAEDEMIRDRLVLGCKDKAARARLFREPNVDLKKAVEALRISETTMEQLRQLDESMEQEAIHSLSEKAKWKKDKPVPKNIINCKYCGRTHAQQKELCPAFGKLCHKCKKANHFQGVCRQHFQVGTSTNYRQSGQTLHHVGLQEESDQGNDEQLFRIQSLRQVGTKKRFMVTIVINNKLMECQLDTGSTCNVMTGV